MTSGGARNNSGPAKDPTSRTSERAGYSLTPLPAEGFDGPVPKFPLPKSTPRERAVWRQVWRTPSACVWALPSQAWRLSTVALWVRTSVRCEAADAPASLLAQLRPLAAEALATEDSLLRAGYRIAVDEVAAKRAEHDQAVPEPEEQAPVRRLRGDAQS
jgi:hypothetical protein